MIKEINYRLMNQNRSQWLRNEKESGIKFKSEGMDIDLYTRIYLLNY